MKKNRFLLVALCLLATMAAFAQKTEVQLLSGKGKDDSVKWEFQCTAGRNSGSWTTIPVPSNWEFFGFGNYTYGSEREDKNEAGLYRHQFMVPKTWSGKDVLIVFDGSMTDTEVKINGQLAGPIHQGAFYRFKYNITDKLKFGEQNLLEVTVHKVSANQLVNEAERTADYWVFGGIFRPVFLQAFPKEHLQHIAIDAKADGSIKLNAFPFNLTSAATITAQVKTKGGKPFGKPFSVAVKPGDSLVQLRGKVASPKLWSTEYPNLYDIDITLKKGTTTLHSVTETIGFRTVELRHHDGFYINGKKIRFKGVNRGSFWPSSGRTTSEALSISDAGLIKDMNMNAVRMSHYPPDEHFLRACDSIGLFVIDELSGWQYPPYDTLTGKKLVRELIEKDVNHPSVVLWANGNEGGFNFGLLPEYRKHDVQARPVIQPWMNINGMNTKHYIPYNYGINTFFQGNDVFFPTEFLHGLYDGGHGAGLDDFWNLMLSNPLSAGGFLWDFCDQGAVRTDQNGRLDTKGNAAADGILGPYREKEGSFYTIKEIWSPVYFEKRTITKAFDGVLAIQNRYDFTNLRECNFSWRLKKITGLNAKDTTSVTGNIISPDIAPKASGTLKLVLPSWSNYDVLYITATDRTGRQLNTWSFPITTPKEMMQRLLPVNNGQVTAKEEDGKILLSTNGVEVTIDQKTGMLLSVKNGHGNVSLKNGPFLIQGEATTATVRHKDSSDDHLIIVSYDGKQRYRFTWTMMPSGILQLRYQFRPDNNEEMLGVSFDYPEENVKSIQLIGSGPYHVYKNRMKGTTFNTWTKTYNNTVTGESWEYPEFKGYYSNFYATILKTNESDFSIYTESENMFLHLFNPAMPKGLGRANSMAVYPKSGGISFMQGITAIGTKSQKKEDLGPQSQLNITFANGGTDVQAGIVYFDFR